MLLLLYAILALLLAGAFVCLLLGRRFAALRVASGSLIAACVAGLWMSARVLALGDGFSGVLPFPLPLGRCLFSVDALAAVFLLPVFFLAGIGGLLLPFRIRALEGAGGSGDIHYGRHGFFYCILAAAMVLVLCAAEAVFFLIAWEVMSLTPFFLISPQDKDSKERYAVWIYLVAAHLGALALLLLFADMSVQAGSGSFADLAAFAQANGWQGAGLLFILSLLGFGVKAGLVPLHMWMPEAHASAPGHVAVLLSGTMLNLGIYGILRVLVLLGAAGGVELWWAWTLMGVGVFSGVLGILLALAQSDMKRTLAYSSAENMGIICLALGAGLLAARQGAQGASVLFFGGALLHMWNHSLFKSLLFLGANAIKESTHVTTIRMLGGLHKRVPFTGGCFALGCAAIAGVPPFNGFMGELLIYLGFASASAASGNMETAFVFWGGFFALGAIAGLALFAFTRMFGLIFLGAPRSAESLQAKEPDVVLRAVMLLLALLCLAVPLSGPWLLGLMRGAVAAIGLVPQEAYAHSFAAAQSALGWYAAAGVLLLAVFAAAALLLYRATRKNGVRSGPTWDCGYRYPDARMQYTGASFSLSLALILRPLLRPKLDVPEITPLFPGESRAVMTSPDWLSAVWERVIFQPVASAAEWIKNMQSGLVNMYILYMFIALVAALSWALGWAS